MSKTNAAPDRDEILFSFHRAHDRPTASQVDEWANRYPQFADDIREHAAVLMEWADELEDEALEPDETMLARGRSRALNALHQARREAASAAPATSWQGMLSAAGFTIPRLANHINIDRGVIADLAAGRMRLPIGRRLVEALIVALNTSTDALEQAVLQLLGARRLGHAKAAKQPTVHARSYGEIIRDSPMSDERKRYWLGED